MRLTQGSLPNTNRVVGERKSLFLMAPSKAIRLIDGPKALATQVQKSLDAVKGNRLTIASDATFVVYVSIETNEDREKLLLLVKEAYHHEYAIDVEDHWSIVHPKRVHFVHTGIEVFQSK
jgi:hypothetical protein